MAHQTKAGAPGQAAALPTADDARQLRGVITTIDAISQEHCSQIRSLARLVLGAMKEPAFYRDPEVIARALETVAYLAEDMENTISAEAEALGANWTDAAAFQRAAACSKFMQEAKQ